MYTVGEQCMIMTMHRRDFSGRVIIHHRSTCNSNFQLAPVYAHIRR